MDARAASTYQYDNSGNTLLVANACCANAESAMVADMAIVAETATTASALAAPPVNCGFGSGMFSFGISDNGNALCDYPRAEFLTGSVPATSVPLAQTATALAANPVDCASSPQGYAHTIDATGNLSCKQIAYSEISGAPASLGAEPFITSAASSALSNERVLTAGTNIMLDTSVAGQIKINAAGGGGGMPTGMIFPFAGATCPAGSLPADGAAVSRASYAALWTLIATTYGSGDGSTTFNVPDLRGRTVVGTGQGAGLTNRSRNDSGGAETHTLTKGEMPGHNHLGVTGGQTADHSHVLPTIYNPNGSNLRWYTPGNYNGGVPHTSGGTSNDHGHSIPLEGGGQAHNNMQPFRALPYCIWY
jgi:microcystin-dependent protein